MNALTKIDLKNFHFLRPEWLWLFIPAALIFLILILSIREQSKWKSVISSRLQPYMFTDSSKWAFILPVVVYFFVTLAIIFALAGPAWKKIDVPGSKIQAVVLIIMDVSQSMMVDDIQPNRLERAKFKVGDFLDENPRARAGLLAMAGTTHTVLPFTSDYNIVKFQSKSLKTSIMPVQGRDLSQAMTVADSLMRKIEAPSTLMLVTDELLTDEIPLLTNFVRNSPHRIEILLMSTSQGGRVPGHFPGTIEKDETGAEVFSKPDQNVLNTLKAEEGITVNLLTLDKSDVEQMATRVRDKLDYRKGDKNSDKDWQDEGIWFLIPVVLLTLLWFRKGWVIQWCFVLGLSFLTSCSVDSREAGWWYTRDYQGQVLYNSERYEEASDRFSDIRHKAAAAYKAGDYETAAELFALDSSASGKYNQGLSLVRLGKYDDAQRLFVEALKADSSLEQARASLKRTLQLVSQIDSVTRLGKQEEVPKTKDKSPLKKIESTPEDEKLSSDTDVKKLPKNGERMEDETMSGMRRGKESDKIDSTDSKPDQQAQNYILQKISADPSEFLRKRFLLQKNKYYPNVKEGNVKW